MRRPGAGEEWLNKLEVRFNSEDDIRTNSMPVHYKK